MKLYKHKYYLLQTRLRDTMYFSTRWQEPRKYFRRRFECGFQLFEITFKPTIRVYPNRTHCALKYSPIEVLFTVYYCIHTPLVVFHYVPLTYSNLFKHCSILYLRYQFYFIMSNWHVPIFNIVVFDTNTTNFLQYVNMTYFNFI